MLPSRDHTGLGGGRMAGSWLHPFPRASVSSRVERESSGRELEGVGRGLAPKDTGDLKLLYSKTPQSLLSTCFSMQGRLLGPVPTPFPSFPVLCPSLFSGRRRTCGLGDGNGALGSPWVGETPLCRPDASNTALTPLCRDRESQPQEALMVDTCPHGTGSLSWCSEKKK